MNRDGTTTQEPTALQQQWSANHWLLQYDLMFGKGYALEPDGDGGPGSGTDRANKRKTQHLFVKNSEKLLKPRPFCAIITKHYTRITMPFCALLG